MRKLSEYLLANPIYAMAAALVCALLPLISVPGGFVAAILVGFVTLCRGGKIGLLVLMGVAIPIFAMALWKRAFLIDLVLLRCMLVWLLATVLRSTVSWRLVIEIMTVLGVVVVLGFHLILEDVPLWWSAVLGRYEVFLSTVLGSQISQDNLHEMLLGVIPIATGLFTALLLLGAFCQLVIARWWQAALFRSGGFAKEFVDIRPGMLLAILFTVTAIAALFRLGFAIDLFPVVVLPVAIGGISLLHKWGRYNKKGIYLIAAVYMGLIFLPMVFIVVLALAGYVDSWYDLRKRYFANHLPKKGV